MKTYNVVFNKNKNKGVFGISLVENPAMEGNFIALSKEDNRIKLQSISEERRELIGLVLEPNKPIYRNQGGEEFNIVFSEETVKDLAYNFAKQGYQNNSTLEHQDSLKLNDVTFVESWIVEDSNKDKSSALGLSYPKGSWLATMKVESDEVWEGFVKNGFVKGFSVDAFVDLEEVNNNQLNMSKIEANETFFERLNVMLSNILKPKEEKEVKLEEVTEEPKKEEVVEVKAEPVAEVAEVQEEVKEELKADEILNSFKEMLTQFKSDIDKDLKGVNEKLLEFGKQEIAKPVKEVKQAEVSLKKKDAIIEYLKNR